MESVRGRATAASLLWPLVIFAALFALFARLGVWQLDRAAEKQALADAFAAGGAAPELEHLPAEIAPSRYASVALEGRYDASHQILLDAMTHDGEVGYEVLTPFEPLGGARWLLVNRGWVSAGLRRDSLPAVPVAEQRRRVTGRLAPLPEPGLRLGESAPQPEHDGLEVRLYPTADELERDLGRPLYPYQLWLAPDDPDGYVRDWHLGGLPPAQHWAYAMQWFALAALVVAVAIALTARHLKRRRTA